MKLLYLFACILAVFQMPNLSTSSQLVKCNIVKKCEEKFENTTKACLDFKKLYEGKCNDSQSTYCANYKKQLVETCVNDFCTDCLQKAEAVYETCGNDFEMLSSTLRNICAAMKKDLEVKCADACKGLGESKENPGKSCNDVHKSNTRKPNGLYWIQPNGDSTAVQAYCDMSFQGGGWTLASYGYVATNGYGITDENNKNIPNMNHPNGYQWNPTSRSGTNGVIALEHGAVNLANGAQFMIMAAGNNPATGGIASYSHVYLIDISDNPYHITFANHGRYRGAAQMHVQEFNVTALKGESGSAKRYALAEALGISWSDSYPTGYGFSPVNAPYGTWDRGPFFPSAHSGDGHTSGCGKAFPPDVENGCPNYVHFGWHSLRSTKMTGQTSIWFQ